MVDGAGGLQGIMQGSNTIEARNTLQGSNLVQGNQFRSQDFLQSLVTAVSQAVAGAPGSLQKILQSGPQGGHASQ